MSGAQILVYAFLSACNYKGYSVLLILTCKGHQLHFFLQQFRLPNLDRLVKCRLREQLILSKKWLSRLLEVE